LAGEIPWAIEDRPVKILVECELACVEGRTNEFMPPVEIFPVQTVLLCELASRFPVPSVCKKNPSDIGKDCRDFWHGEALLEARWLSTVRGGW
jgi:hypothetical protein